MKKISVLMMTAAVAAGMVMTSCDQKGGTANVTMNAPIDSVSYAIGINVGNDLKANLKTFPGGEPVNYDLFISGLMAVMNDTAAMKMTVESAQKLANEYVMKAQQAEVEVELKAGQDFLAANKTKEGVITTESGLQYKVITEGTGAKPTATDQVKCHYTGKLLNGTVFDSSVQRGEPAVFGVEQVIRGWQEVLQLMPVGSKYQIWVPSDLAYGPNGAGQIIKPNATLEFEIELLEIVK